MFLKEYLQTNIVNTFDAEGNCCGSCLDDIKQRYQKRKRPGITPRPFVVQLLLFILRSFLDDIFRREQLLANLVDPSRRKAGHDANSHSGDVVPRWVFRDDRHSHNAQRAAHYLADDRQPLVVQRRSLDGLGGQIANDGDCYDTSD